jgi:hypothetical protein
LGSGRSLAGERRRIEEKNREMGNRMRKRRKKGRENEREAKKKEDTPGQYGCAFVPR